MSLVLIITVFFRWFYYGPTLRVLLKELGTSSFELSLILNLIWDPEWQLLEKMVCPRNNVERDVKHQSHANTRARTHTCTLCNLDQEEDRTGRNVNRLSVYHSLHRATSPYQCKNTLVPIQARWIGVLPIVFSTIFGYIWRSVSTAGETNCSWEWTSNLPLATETTSHWIRTPAERGE